jgi:DNA-binding transcriptional LysR family regulator
MPDVVAVFLAAGSLVAAARELGVSPSAVRYHVVRHERQIGKRLRKPWTAHLKPKPPPGKPGRPLGVKDSRPRQYLKGLKPGRPRGQGPSPRMLQIIEMYRSMGSQMAVAAVLGITKAAVFDCLRRYEQQTGERLRPPRNPEPRQLSLPFRNARGRPKGRRLTPWKRKQRSISPRKRRVLGVSARTLEIVAAVAAAGRMRPVAKQFGITRQAIEQHIKKYEKRTGELVPRLRRSRRHAEATIAEPVALQTLT